MLPNFDQESVQGKINVIPMNFRTDHKLIDGTTDFKEVVYVDLVKKGSNGECTTMSIRELKNNEQLWPFVEPYYEAWHKGQEEPTDGTSIDVLPFLSPGLVAHLKSIMIRTAEDLANADEQTIERIGMGARGFKAKAQAYVEAKIGDGRVAAVNEKLERENASLRADMDEMRKQIESIQAQNTDRPQRPVKRK